MKLTAVDDRPVIFRENKIIVADADLVVPLERNKQLDAPMPVQRRPDVSPGEIVPVDFDRKLIKRIVERLV